MEAIIAYIMFSITQKKKKISGYLYSTINNIPQRKFKRMSNLFLRTKKKLWVFGKEKDTAMKSVRSIRPMNEI